MDGSMLSQIKKSLQKIVPSRALVLFFFVLTFQLNSNTLTEVIDGNLGSSTASPYNVVAAVNCTFFVANVDLIGSAQGSNIVGWYYVPGTGLTEVIDGNLGSSTAYLYNVVAGGNNTFFIPNVDSIGSQGDSDIVGWYYVVSLPPLPPAGIEGVQITNVFPFQIQFLNRLNWIPSSGANVTSYNIFRDGVLIASVSAAGQLTYSDQLINKDESYSYGITAVNSFGMESDPIFVTIP